MLHLVRILIWMRNYPSLKHSLSWCFELLGILTRRPPLVRNLRRFLPLPLLPKVGEEVLRNHGEESARLPLVQLRVVPLSLLAMVPLRLSSGEVFRSRSYVPTQQ